MLDFFFIGSIGGVECGEGYINELWAFGGWPEQARTWKIGVRGFDRSTLA